MNAIDQRRPISSASPAAASSSDVLLYDGLCGVCDATVQFILEHDRRGTLLFAPLQGAFAAALISGRPELAQIDSLLLVKGVHARRADGNSVPPQEAADNGDASRATAEVLVRTDAVVAVGRYLGGFWRAGANLLRLVPRPVRDWGYNRFARIRHRVAGRRDTCRLPTPGERQRFLDS